MVTPTARVAGSGCVGGGLVVAAAVRPAARFACWLLGWLAGDEAGCSGGWLLVLAKLKRTKASILIDC